MIPMLLRQSKYYDWKLFLSVYSPRKVLVDSICTKGYHNNNWDETAFTS